MILNFFIVMTQNRTKKSYTLLLIVACAIVMWGLNAFDFFLRQLDVLFGGVRFPPPK